MNNLLGPVLAIAATAILLLLREFVLSVGRKKSNSLGTPGVERGFPGSEVQTKERLHAVPTKELEESIPEAASIGVDEFLTELRAKSREHAAPPERAEGPESGLARNQLSRKYLVGDWR